MVGGTWWAVSGGQLAVISLQDTAYRMACSVFVHSWLSVFVNVILVHNVVVVVYVVNDGGGSEKYLCYFVMVSAALLFAGE